MKMTYNADSADLTNLWTFPEFCCHLIGWYDFEGWDFEGKLAKTLAWLVCWLHWLHLGKAFFFSPIANRSKLLVYFDEIFQQLSKTYI